MYGQGRKPHVGQIELASFGSYRTARQQGAHGLNRLFEAGTGVAVRYPHLVLDHPTVSPAKAKQEPPPEMWSRMAADIAVSAGFRVKGLTTPTPSLISWVAAARKPSMEKVSSWKYRSVTHKDS